MSSGEAELYAIGQGINEALYVRNIILEAEFARKERIEAFTDSTAGKSMATRFGSGKRTKHVELRYLYMQNLVQQGLLQIKKIGTKNNPADLLTKYVSTNTLKSLIHELGVVQHHFKLSNLQVSHLHFHILLVSHADLHLRDRDVMTFR